MNKFSSNTGSNPTAKYLILWFILFTCVRYFNILLPPSALKAIEFLSLGLILLVYAISVVYIKTHEFKKGFLTPILLIAISLFTSTIAANYMHDQAILDTLESQYEMYFFLLYFMLHRYRPNPERLANMLIVIGLAYCSVYFVQYVAYPKIFLTAKVFEDRGTIRIFMPGAAYLFSAYFLCLSRYFIYKKIKYLLLILPMFIVFFLLGTRQVLASVALLTLINIMLSKTLKSKILMYFLMVICVIPVYFLFQGIFENMFKVTQEQSTDMGDNIRIKAAYYFVFEYNNNPIWMLFGNGMPEYNSKYGRFIFSLTETFGFYQADIGIIGDFSKFGILFVVARLYMLIKMATAKLTEGYTFIRYNTLSVLMTMFTGGGLDSQEVVLTTIMMYMTDLNTIMLKPDPKLAESTEVKLVEKNEINSQ